MIQGHTTLENYQLNAKYLQHLKPQNIEFVIIGHCHCDHIGMIPSLYAKRKCNATIVVPEHSTQILKQMWLDSAYIISRDVEKLNFKGDKHYVPFYTEQDIEYVLQFVKEVSSHEFVKLSNELTIRYTNAGHILLSKQTEMFVGSKDHVKKILFSSDLGNIATQDSRVFVEKFEPVQTANIAFMECTYGGKYKEITQETLQKDISKIKTVVEQYCVENHHRVLIPTFSLDRMPYILYILYSLFGNTNFDIPILVDSPLANRLLDCYANILTGEAKDIFDSMMSWKNIKRIVDPEVSKAAVASNGAKIICASSGMLTAGRSIKWTQSILPNENDCILFIGYCGEDTLAYKIQHESENKTININGKPYKNKANIISLHSFSSHMQHHDMIEYYKSINCERIYLVHADKNKLQFKKDLQDAVYDSLKSTKIIAVNKGMKILL